MQGKVPGRRDDEEMVDNQELLAIELNIRREVLLRGGLKKMSFGRDGGRKRLVYRSGDTRKREVALTFDDGPDPVITRGILDVLRDQSVKGTFFMLGRNVERFPGTASRVASSGHEIGNHFYNHRVALHPPAVVKEITRAERAIREATGVWPGLFRPPFGANGKGFSREAYRLGYLTIKWSVNSGDWLGAEGDKIVRKVMRSARGGAIILMHDGDFGERRKGGQTVAAVEKLLGVLKEEGYRPVTVSRLLGFPPSEPRAKAEALPLPPGPEDF